MMAQPINAAFVAGKYAPVHERKAMAWGELSAMLGSVQTGAKDGTGWLPADIEPGPRTGERVNATTALVLDVEADAKKDPETGIKRIVGSEPLEPDAMLAEVALTGWACILHTSYSHHDQSIEPVDQAHPRYRLVFPLSRPLKNDEIKPLGLHVAALMGIADCIDAGCLEPARLYYLPRCPAERLADFRHDVVDGAPLDVDVLLSAVRREAAALTKATKQKRGARSGNVINAFNQAHAIGAILEVHGYIAKGRNRWLHPSSISGLPGVRRLPDSTPERVFSSHGNDPLNDGHAHDAFDCFRLLQHGGDMMAAVREAARILGLSDKRGGPASDFRGGGGDMHQQAEKNAPGGDKDGRDDKPDKPSTAKALVDMAVKHCDLFHDERQDGYAVTVYNGVRRTLKLRSREFKRWLAGSFYAESGRPANNEAMASALSVLEAKATFDGRELDLSNRFAWRDDVLFIDMADAAWRVVKITGTGWEIMDKPPVLFRRYSHQQKLPDPARGTPLSAIHEHLAIRHDDDKLLVEAWLVACAFPHLPRPAVTFHGPQGASKSTAARILKSITDPSVTDSVDLGKGPSELAQVLDHHAVPWFDNLTTIQGWASDLLCRGVTGGAFSKRELYSDDSDILLTFKRAMVFTGINVPTHAPDLLDRLLLIELERIPPEQRMDESTFWATFDTDRPRLLGALLDALVGTLKHLPTIKLDRMPRMADFARIACAYAEFSGIGADKMLDIIMRHTSRQTQEVLDADPIASAIRDFIGARKTWTGTAQQLLALLNEQVPAPKPDGWPRQGNSLSRKLNVLHATLNEVGITIRRHKDKDRKLTLESSAEIPSLSSTSSEPTIHAGFEPDDPRTIPTMNKTSSGVSSMRRPSIHAVSDDTDDKDDKFAVLSDDIVEDEV